MANFDKIPWAGWMEAGLQTLMEAKAEKVMLCGILPDGNVVTGYSGMDAEDKSICVHHIQSDIMMDVLAANADVLRAILREEDDDDGLEE